jgi:hypothetical protein
MGHMAGVDGWGKSGFFCSLVLSLYFIRTRFFVRVVLVFAFYPSCTTHTAQTSMPPAGFEPAIPAGKRPQTYVLDHTATGIGIRSPDRPTHSRSDNKH